MKRHAMYLIRWRDHYSTDGFLAEDLSDIVDNVFLDSVGFFVKADKNYYHFVRTIGDDMAADSMSILRNQIVKLHEIIVSPV